MKKIYNVNLGYTRSELSDWFKNFWVANHTG